MDFDKLPPNVQKLFYTVAITCTDGHEACKKILQGYNKLLLEAEIFGRKELTDLIGIHPAQKISETLKGQLKSERVFYLQKKFGAHPSTVYFYDDSHEIIDEVSPLGINAVLVKGISPTRLHDLVKTKQKNPTSVSLVLLDFDKTFAVSRFKKKYHRYNLDFVIETYLGGKHRVDLLFKNLKKLEELGSKVGFITFHTKEVLQTLLERLGWI